MEALPEGKRFFCLAQTQTRDNFRVRGFAPLQNQDFSQFVHLNARNIPTSPPTADPSKDEKENPWAPNSVGTYPPAREPITMPIIIMVFRDIWGIPFLL
jgi:hypothetical protein